MLFKTNMISNKSLSAKLHRIFIAVKVEIISPRVNLVRGYGHLVTGFLLADRPLLCGLSELRKPKLAVFAASSSSGPNCIGSRSGLTGPRASSLSSSSEECPPFEEVVGEACVEIRLALFNLKL